LGIHIGDQRKRPNCSIHAIVGALEYLEGGRHGAAGNLSENYLCWATLKNLGRFDQSELCNRPGGGNGDAGFQLREVIQALRAFGVPNASEVERFGFVDVESDIQAPTLDLVQAARHRSQFRAFVIPGRDPNILLGNIVHPLNAGEPVVIGLAAFSVDPENGLHRKPSAPGKLWACRHSGGLPLSDCEAERHNFHLPKLMGPALGSRWVWIHKIQVHRP